jgi:hypothetical protein
MTDISSQIPGAYLSGAPERWSFTQVGSCLTQKHYIKLQRPPRNKHSSLLRKFVIYGCKKYYNIVPWGQCCIKLLSVFYKFSFYGRIFVRLDLKKVGRDKHASLLPKIINYGHKSFITLWPGGKSGSWFIHIKSLCAVHQAFSCHIFRIILRLCYSLKFYSLSHCKLDNVIIVNYFSHWIELA